jgi:DNA-3-methyladenine glycosylase
LTKHFQITSGFNDQLLTRVGGLWVEANPDEIRAEEIVAKPRVGVDYAGAEWAAIPWRFVWTSKLWANNKVGNLAAF